MAHHGIATRITNLLLPDSSAIVLAVQAVPAMLSEKAKGKRRAVDPEINGTSSQLDSRNLTIRFTEGVPDLVLHVMSTDTVRDVKAKVCFLT